VISRNLSLGLDLVALFKQSLKYDQLQWVISVYYNMLIDSEMCILIQMICLHVVDSCQCGMEWIHHVSQLDFLLWLTSYCGVCYKILKWLFTRGGWQLCFFVCVSAGFIGITDLLGHHPRFWSSISFKVGFWLSWLVNKQQRSCRLL